MPWQHIRPLTGQTRSGLGIRQASALHLSRLHRPGTQTCCVFAVFLHAHPPDLLVW